MSPENVTPTPGNAGTPAAGSQQGAPGGEKPVSREEYETVVKANEDQRKTNENLRSLHDRQRNEDLTRMDRLEQSLAAPAGGTGEPAAPTPDEVNAARVANVEANTGLLQFYHEAQISGEPVTEDERQQIIDIAADRSRNARFAVVRDGVVDYKSTFSNIRDHLQVTELKKAKADAAATQSETEKKERELTGKAVISGGSVQIGEKVIDLNDPNLDIDAVIASGALDEHIDMNDPPAARKKGPKL